MCVRWFRERSSISMAALSSENGVEESIKFSLKFSDTRDGKLAMVAGMMFNWFFAKLICSRLSEINTIIFINIIIFNFDNNEIVSQKLNIDHFKPGNEGISVSSFSSKSRCCIKLIDLKASASIIWIPLELSRNWRIDGKALKSVPPIFLNLLPDTSRIIKWSSMHSVVSNPRLAEVSWLVEKFSTWKIF